MSPQGGPFGGMTSGRVEDFSSSIHYTYTMRDYHSALAWVVAADMGYGHLRAAYPLRDIAAGGILTAGVDDGTSRFEKMLWSNVRGVYAALSRVQRIPVIGKRLFDLVDTIQRIPPFNPAADLSGSTYQVNLLTSLIRQGLCSGLLEKINGSGHLPLLTSFYAPAIAAEMHGFSATYCILCDADFNRAWVAQEPTLSRVTYFAPCTMAASRLKVYGVPEDKIFLTGFPLPPELLGGRDISILKSDFAERLLHLDPIGRFSSLHDGEPEMAFGRPQTTPGTPRPLTLTYAVGGAGAQKEIGRQIAYSLKSMLQSGTLKLNLVAGIKSSVRDFFLNVKSNIAHGNENIGVIYGETFGEYVRQFNAVLRTTDILWTKPSELSFYSALGMPIIMSPALGSQEQRNREWLLEVQAGIDQLSPQHTEVWLMDMLEAGKLADAAWAGFRRVRKLGTYAIIDILKGEKPPAEDFLQVGQGG